MAAMNFRAPQPLVRAALVALGGLALLAGGAAGQTVGGAAFGSYVNALGVTAQSPVATLPDTLRMAAGIVVGGAADDGNEQRHFRQIEL